MFDTEYFEKADIVKEVISFQENTEPYKGDDVFHVAFNIDSNFFMPTGITITSILEHNKDINLAFHIFADNAKSADVKNLRLTAEKYHQNIYIYILDMQPFSNFHIKHPRFQRVSYFRLYMPKVLRKVAHHFLYIDADTICINSLQPFKEINLQNKPVAAVAQNPKSEKKFSTFLGLKSGRYVNSGVLWIDVDEWERQGLTEKCFAYSGSDPNRFWCHDQDILNLVLDGNIEFLSEKFNHLGSYKRKAPDDCIIYHFFGRTKPWDMAISEYEMLWRKYCKISYWPTLTDPLPPRQPKYYFYYKYASRYYWQQREYYKAFTVYLDYSVLKFIQTLQLFTKP
jgi:lipopolysaccharide biosynthesis glycosyltransferase